MPESKARTKSLLEFLLIFAAIYLLSQLLLQTLFPGQFTKNGAKRNGGIVLHPVDATVKGGHHPILLLKNGTDQGIVLPDRCPMPPVDVFFVEEEMRTALTANKTALPCEPLMQVAAGEQVQVNLAPWKYSLFERYGVYEVRLPVGTGAVVTNFTHYEPGAVTKLFRALITKPFLNFLIFVASLLPDHNLGIAIIVLTFLVKVLLFFPTQHALQGQKEMQKLQPKIEELKTRYGGDPQKLQEETMKLWREHKVNPFQSCLPMLIQFPVLIGLFFVVRDGSVLALSHHLVYPIYKNLSWTFGTSFLGFDLLQPSVYLMPVTLAVLQFAQMKLSFAAAKRKIQKQGETADKQQRLQQQLMLYGLPLMVGFFAIQFPAAVSLYWGVSTVFAIGQQIIVNRKPSS